MRVPEVQQPDIDVPSSEDPMAWARFAQIAEQWERQVAPQLGIDVEKLVMGYVLSTIIGDDENCFTWSHGGVSYKPEWAMETREYLLFRMNWEISVPELPDEVRSKLEAMREKVGNGELADWETLEVFNLAYHAWRQTKGEIEELIDVHPEYQEALHYNHEMWESKLHKPYQKFLYPEVS